MAVFFSKKWFYNKQEKKNLLQCLFYVLLCNKHFCSESNFSMKWFGFPSCLHLKPQWSFLVKSVVSISKVCASTKLPKLLHRPMANNVLHVNLYFSGYSNSNLFCYLKYINREIGEIYSFFVSFPWRWLVIEKICETSR